MTSKNVSKILKDILNSEDFLAAITEGVESKLGEILDRLNQYDTRLTNLESKSNQSDRLILEVQLDST